MIFFHINDLCYNYLKRQNMAYKWENGKIKRISLPKKLSKKNQKLLEKMAEMEVNYDESFSFLKKLNIKVYDATEYNKIK